MSGRALSRKKQIEHGQQTEKGGRIENRETIVREAGAEHREYIIEDSRVTGNPMSWKESRIG